MERAHAQFALALHQQLPAGGNLPWSPYSVACGLGLAAAGARGQTQAELAGVLVPGGELAALGPMLQRAAAPREAEAAVANSLWLDPRVRCHESYQRTVLGWPGGEVHTVDFREDPDGSRLKINESVARSTRDLVRDLLPAGTISPQTAAVIANALYLKVAWRQPFEARATTPAPFHAPAGTRQVPTMRQQATFRYAKIAGWQMVTLPTAGDVVVDVLLPDDPAAAPDALPDPETLLTLRGTGRPSRVDLTLPKLRIDVGNRLDGPLRRLGAVTAFTPGRADFSGIALEEIVLDAVVHKAVLRVDEQGFEGAAATAAVMRLVTMEMGRPMPFHVDRPFLLVVRHPGTGAIYFLARVVEP